MIRTSTTDSAASHLSCLLACAALLGLLAGCGDKPQQSAPRKPQVVVRVIQPQPVTLRTELPGRTAPYASAEVRPQVSGIIRERLFTEGSNVTAGEVLYQIEPGPFRAALEQEEASLASAEAAARISQLLIDRYRKLLPENTISQQDYDNAAAQFAQAQAAVQMHRAAANAARINLQWTRVTAPIAGRTGRSLVTPGALVSANQANALTIVSQLDPIYVDLTQSSADILRLRRAAGAGEITRGAPATRNARLILEDGSTYPLEGRIQLTEVTVDQSTGAVALRAVFANPDRLLLPGMYVRAVIDEGVDSNGILAPQEAVTRDRKGAPSVRLVNAEGKLETREVVATRAIGADWLVSSGLEPGDRLVIEGAPNARPGTAVDVVPAPTAATARPAALAAEAAAAPAAAPVAR